MPAPDGSYKILFADDTADGFTDQFLMNLDGTGFVQLTDTPDRAEVYPSWSRSADQVAVSILSINGITLFYDCRERTAYAWRSCNRERPTLSRASSPLSCSVP